MITDKAPALTCWGFFYFGEALAYNPDPPVSRTFDHGCEHAMPSWIDPRTNPQPPYRGPKRRLAQDLAELADLVAACRAGRLYAVEGWIERDQPLQMDPERVRRGTRPSTPVGVAISTGNFDLAHLLLCNGYRIELELRSPADDALDARRWDLLNLLLDWGADPTKADIWRILETYERAVLDRFWAAGVDLARDGVMARTLAKSTRNRALYGFVKNYRDRDARIQRALDEALCSAIEEKNDKAVSLCLWAGADPRRRVVEGDETGEEDEYGMNAIERALFRGTTKYLDKLGFDRARDGVQSLYSHVHKLDALRALIAIEPPKDWHPITASFLNSFSFSVHSSIRLVSLYDVEQVFALGGRIDALDRSLKRDLRRTLLLLDEYDAHRLFRLLRDPDNMARTAFIGLIANEKLADRYLTWPPRSGINRELLEDLVSNPGVPAPVRRLAQARLAPPPRRIATQTSVNENGAPRPLTREELHELVWSEPLATLSKRFGLSDNGLRKRCAAMNVPTPPRGYWQKLREGHKVIRPSLPPPS